ncbi:MAG: nitroreductase family protein [Saprospiraceae bacterium]|nr:nitroreductase family protein [Saprospiraceae bacterium]MCB9323058.1 nitroreductase family protein [Lewinellaceae bacterium]
MHTSNYVPYHVLRLTEQEAREKSEEYYRFMDRRRTVREFSSKPVDRIIIENIIKTASTAPSGAHKQPWVFCAVSNPEIKKEIRKAAEQEEFENYHGRMSEEWLEDLKVFETNEQKEFLETAPWLIVVFKKAYDEVEGAKMKNYYVNESVGLATGVLLTAIHNAGLVALTHTPSPMRFLQKILNRPENERPFLLIPVGFPADHPKVPDLTRKPLEEISVFWE